MVRNYWEPDQPSTFVKLEPDLMAQTKSKKEEWVLVAMAGCGKFRKLAL